MSSAAGGWFVIVLACICANLPFINQRLFAIIPLRTARKSLWVRLFELVAFYLLVGAVGFAVESSIGGSFPQGWQFYAVTGSMMLVFAFPGFTWQYLVKHR